MSYTPYTASGGCKDAGAVASDLLMIKGKGFTTIRLYGTDCDGLNSVGAAAAAAGLKMIVGVFIKADGVAGARPQIGQIVAWGNAGNWGKVVMLIVGNEAIHQGFSDGPSLAGLIGEAKAALVAAGQGGIPVSTAETVASLGQYKDVLCPVMDVAGANIQTFFDGSVVAENAGDFVLAQLDLIKGFCPGKSAYYNFESGWPSGGASNGASIASPQAQQAAMGSIIAKAGDRTVIFSHQDDLWKAPGIEQHFGCAQWF
jgi:exo-beta-1,3-glucanase (GH17 family)